MNPLQRDAFLERWRLEYDQNPFTKTVTVKSVADENRLKEYVTQAALQLAERVAHCEERLILQASSLEVLKRIKAACETEIELRLSGKHEPR